MIWVDDAADYLTGLVLTVEYVLDPQAIFFGGRLPGRVISGLMDRVALHAFAPTPQVLLKKKSAAVGSR